MRRHLDGVARTEVQCERTIAVSAIYVAALPQVAFFDIDVRMAEAIAITHWVNHDTRIDRSDERGYR